MVFDQYNGNMIFKFILLGKNPQMAGLIALQFSMIFVSYLKQKICIWERVGSLKLQVGKYLANLNF